MSAVVVLGMHRSGTSLVAQMLQAMGVNMGDNLAELYEDVDFFKLNVEILYEAGGEWCEPPPLDEIKAAGDRMRHAIAALVDRKRKPPLWGWKDPRTALTIPLYHSLLEDPRYIVIRRDREDVVESMTRRNGEGDWGRLWDYYNDQIAAFTRDRPEQMCHVRYEDLTHPKAAPFAVRKLAEFLGLDRYAVARALDCIEYRDEWGWGRIGVGVPYYKSRYEFFQWWSFLIAGGFRAGDKLLNNHNVPGEVPIPMAHNAIVREFLRNPDLDTLCIIEDDHCGEQDVVERMRTKAENRAFDIVCASYVNRRDGSHVAVGCNFAEGTNSEYGEYGMTIEPFKVKLSGTQEYDVAALGLVLIRRWVLEAMLAGNDPGEFFWFDWLGRNSQDVRFYWQTRQLGARTGVDRDNAIGHIGHRIFYMKDFEARRDLLRQELIESGDYQEAEHGY